MNGGMDGEFDGMMGVGMDGSMGQRLKEGMGVGIDGMVGGWLGCKDG